jgi:hypothetical protein
MGVEKVCLCRGAEIDVDFDVFCLQLNDLFDELFMIVLTSNRTYHY